MAEFNELTKKVVAFLDEMQNLGFKLTYGVSFDNSNYETVEVDFSSSVVQALVYCLLRDLSSNETGLSCFCREGFYIYCDND